MTEPFSIEEAILHGDDCPKYTARDMRVYAAQAVAAERERMIADGWRQTRYAAPVTDCEACLTPDACAIRGQCGHYLRERTNHNPTGASPV